MGEIKRVSFGAIGVVLLTISIITASVIQSRTAFGQMRSLDEILDQARNGMREAYREAYQESSISNCGVCSDGSLFATSWIDNNDQNKNGVPDYKYCNGKTNKDCDVCDETITQDLDHDGLYDWEDKEKCVCSACALNRTAGDPSFSFFDDFPASKKKQAEVEWIVVTHWILGPWFFAKQTETKEGEFEWELTERNEGELCFADNNGVIIPAPAQGKCTCECLDGDGDKVCQEFSEEYYYASMGAPAVKDNCPGFPNLNQADSDGDGIGDACDKDFVKPATPVCSLCPADQKIPYLSTWSKNLQNDADGDKIPDHVIIGGTTVTCDTPEEPEPEEETPLCGNGVRDDSEECDPSVNDSYTNNLQKCNSDCTLKQYLVKPPDDPVVVTDPPVTHDPVTPVEACAHQKKAMNDAFDAVQPAGGADLWAKFVAAAKAYCDCSGVDLPICQRPLPCDGITDPQLKECCEAEGGIGMVSIEKCIPDSPDPEIVKEGCDKFIQDAVNLPIENSGQLNICCLEVNNSAANATVSGAQSCINGLQPPSVEEEPEVPTTKAAEEILPMACEIAPANGDDVVGKGVIGVTAEGKPTPFLVTITPPANLPAGPSMISLTQTAGKEVSLEGTTSSGDEVTQPKFLKAMAAEGCKGEMVVGAPPITSLFGYATQEFELEVACLGVDGTVVAKATCSNQAKTSVQGGGGCSLIP